MSHSDNAKIEANYDFAYEQGDNGFSDPNLSESRIGLNPEEMIQEAARKREHRLVKNREAARECRRKKKEYIKCLENRVQVLENQNKALIEELHKLKRTYEDSGSRVQVIQNETSPQKYHHNGSHSLNNPNQSHNNQSSGSISANSGNSGGGTHMPNPSLSNQIPQQVAAIQLAMANQHHSQINNHPFT